MKNLNLKRKKENEFIIFIKLMENIDIFKNEIKKK